MLPDPHDLPAIAPKASICGGIAFDVAPQLGAPIERVDSWIVPVLWACMPKAAVDKHRDPPTREYDIRPNNLAIL